jgi:fumarate reductase flavoprotein subunit
MSNDVTVLVAGAGGSGLAAALASAHLGADVLLLDADATYTRSCNTSMTAAMLPAAGSRYQAEAGIPDSPDQFLADIVRKTKGEVYTPLAERLTSVSAELVHWFVDQWDLPFQLVTDIRYPGHTWSRCHSMPDRLGATLHSLLTRRVAGLDGVTTMVPVSLRSISRREDDDGWLAELVRPDGSTDSMTAGAVVLATGGFGGNHDLVARHIPAMADAMYFGSEFHQGDALRMGAAIGADQGFLESYQGHGSVSHPQNIPVPWPVMMAGGFIVNVSGRRFGDESQGYSEFAVQVLGQPGREAWVVLDQGIHDLCQSMPDYRSVAENIDLHWSPTWQELAEKVGLPATALETTAQQVSRFVEGRAVDALGRTDWERCLTPPYAAVRISGSLYHTQGGLLVDQDARVLRNGEPVPHLYAAGGSAVGISGHGATGYLAGNGLLAALGLGYLAGRAAATD